VKSLWKQFALAGVALGALVFSVSPSRADPFRVNNAFPFRVNNAYVGWPNAATYSRSNWVLMPNGTLFFPSTTYSSYRYPSSTITYPSGTTATSYAYSAPALASYQPSNYSGYATMYSQPTTYPYYGTWYAPYYGNYSYPGYGTSYGSGFGGSYSGYYGGGVPPTSYSYWP
jgi:hypothetical protein